MRRAAESSVFHALSFLLEFKFKLQFVQCGVLLKTTIWRDEILVKTNRQKHRIGNWSLLQGWLYFSELVHIWTVFIFLLMIPIWCSSFGSWLFLVNSILDVCGCFLLDFDLMFHNIHLFLKISNFWTGHLNMEEMSYHNLWCLLYPIPILK